MTSKTIAAQLGQSGLSVWPGFLSAKSLFSTAQDLDDVRARGEFVGAGVGRRRGREVDARVRGDETFWLERDLTNRARAVLWRRIDLLRLAFNRSLFLGLTDFEGHYAVYPEGGFYARHLDRFRDSSDRVVSIVLYLNREWKAEDGGRLRVYGESAGRPTHTDIDPVGGTLVCFMSGESEHEVLLSHRPRFSMAGWFKRARG